MTKGFAIAVMMAAGAMISAAQALGEHPIGDVGDGGTQLGVARRPLPQDLDDRARPAPADQLDRLVEARAQPW